MSTEKSKSFIYNKRNNNKTARVGLERKITHTFPSDDVVWGERDSRLG